jgi:hypothetical protein
MGYFPPGCQIATAQQFFSASIDSTTPEQTDVFSINGDGQLCVSWLDDSGYWQGPLTIGPKALAFPGTFLAAAQQSYLNQTEVFAVDTAGHLNVFWVGGDNIWHGPKKISDPVFPTFGTYIATSQQFGLSQTDIFLIDNSGQVNVFWMDDKGNTWGPKTIGPAGIAAPGSPLAVAQLCGRNATGVFLTGPHDQLNVISVENGGVWGHLKKINSTNFAPQGSFIAACQRRFGRSRDLIDQTGVFVIDHNGQLQYFWLERLGKWNGPKPLGFAGTGAPGGALAASQIIGQNENAVFLVDGNGQLNLFVNKPEGWRGGYIGEKNVASQKALLAASPDFSNDQTDVFLIDGKGLLNIFSPDSSGAWQSLVRGDPVPAPSSGLGNNSNYSLACNCNPVTDLQVNVLVTEDIVVQSGNGFSFQLNTSSPLTCKNEYQQFVLSFANNEAFGGVNFYFGPKNVTNNQPNKPEYIWCSPSFGAWSGGSIVAGTVLSISLTNDAAGNITSATYSATDPQGVTMTTTFELLTIPQATPDDLAPITIFQLNLVGPGGEEHVVL